jgi:hypothetical protein
MQSKFYDHDHGEHGPWKMTGQSKKILHTLNDLIRINIDRITAYEKAAHTDTTREPELRGIFYRLGTESRAYVNILHAEVIKLGGAPVTQQTITGKIYLHWLEGKNRIRRPFLLPASMPKWPYKRLISKPWMNKISCPNVYTNWWRTNCGPLSELTSNC